MLESSFDRICALVGTLGVLLCMGVGIWVLDPRLGFGTRWDGFWNGKLATFGFILTGVGTIREGIVFVTGFLTKMVFLRMKGDWFLNGSCTDEEGCFEFMSENGDATMI